MRAKTVMDLLEVDDDAVYQRLRRCLPELSAEFHDRVVEPEDVLSVLHTHGLHVVPMEEFDDEC